MVNDIVKLRKSLYSKMLQRAYDFNKKDIFACKENTGRSSGSMLTILISDWYDYRNFYYFSLTDEY